MADNEYIKRSEVVGLVEDKLKRCETVLEALAFASLRTAVMGLRSADVAPRAGWIKDNTSKFEHRYNCSVCDFRQIGKPTPYCPNCGARMKGGE